MKPSHGDFNSQSVSLTPSSYKSESIKTFKMDMSNKEIFNFCKGVATCDKILVESGKHVDDYVSNQPQINSKEADFKPINFISPKHAISALEHENAFLEIINFANKKSTEQNKLCECCSCCLHRCTAGIYQYACSQSRSSVYSERKKRRIVHSIGNHRTRKADQIRSDPCSCISKAIAEPKFKPDFVSEKLRTEKSESSTGQFGKKTEEKGSKCKIVTNTASQCNVENLCGTEASGMECSNTVSRQQIGTMAIMNLFDGILRSDLSSIGGGHCAHQFQINSFVKSSFYAMSFQIRHNNKKQFKLEPHECEPGVCVPGECDPIECQKLIMNRLLGKSSTMTSTKMRAKSISSGTSDFHPNLRSQKQQSREFVAKPKLAHDHNGFKYQTLPKRHKKAVRISSSFSFNIEFSKDKSGNVDKPAHIKKSSSINESSVTEKNYKSKGTEGYKYGNRDGESQSGTLMHHKGSMMAPQQKRCFCTLKLQKRGKLQKRIDLKTKEVPPVNIYKFATKGQNTNVCDLDPNECEPKICVPGVCDPYECLEIIKRRNRRCQTRDFKSGEKSLNTSASKMSSSSTSISKQVQRKRKRKPIQRLESKVSGVRTVQPSRQAVRIGSSFSFDVTFSKDKSINEGTEESTFNRSHKRKRPTKSEKTQGNLHRNQSLEKKIQYSKSYQNQNEQAKVPTSHESTKTSSFLQRCFCTAKFHKFNRHVKRHIGKTRKFGAEKNVRSRDMRQTTVGSQTYRTHKIRKKRHQFHDVLKLKPYECEPGFCVPDQCNPQVCMERIRSRKKHVHQMSLTDTPSTKTISTFSVPYKTSKSAYSQIQIPKQHEQKKIRKRVKGKSFTDYTSSQRNAVKIGSNFSFNIEFYKEKTTADINVDEEVSEEKPRVKMVSRNTNGGRVGRKARCQGSCVSCTGRRMQTDSVKTRHKASGMLKRCFCTLALHKKTSTKKRKPKFKCVCISQGTESPSYKVIPDYVDAHNATRPYELEPYECEQGVCTPGQCDPYECEKLIRKRLHREYGTSPPICLVRSTAADAHRRKLRNQDAQSRFHYRPTVNKKQHLKPSKTHKQAVRISSNFSFSIEFYRNTSLRPSTGTHNLKSSRTSSKKVQGITHKRMKNRSVRGDRSKYMHRPSQFYRLRTESKASGISPSLKRCFCTLKLQKDGKQQTKNDKYKPMPSMVDVSMKTKNKYKPAIYKEAGTKTRQKYRSLDPYECEPGVCVPGFCNPEQCYERIKRRYSKTSGTETMQCIDDCKPGACASQQCDPEECLDRHSKKFGTETAMMNTISSVTDERSPQIVKLQIPMTQQSRSPRQAVKIGSNFNINVEFYKEKGGSNNSTIIRNNESRPYNNLRVRNKNGNTRSSNRGISHYTNTHAMSTDSETQAIQNTENKASAAENLLKRCFCTAKLHQMHTGHINKRPITVGRIDAIQNMTPFKLSRKIISISRKSESTEMHKRHLKNQVCSVSHEDRSFVQLFYNLKQTEPGISEVRNMEKFIENEVSKSKRGQNLSNTRKDNLKNEAFKLGRIDETQTSTPFILSRKNPNQNTTESNRTRYFSTAVNDAFHQTQIRKQHKDKNNKAGKNGASLKRRKIFKLLRLIISEIPNVKKVGNGLTKLTNPIFNKDLTKETIAVKVDNTNIDHKIVQIKQSRKIVIIGDKTRKMYVKKHNNDQSKHKWKWIDIICPCYKFSNHEKDFQYFKNTISPQSIIKPHKSTRTKGKTDVIRICRPIIKYRNCIRKLIGRKIFSDIKINEKSIHDTGRKSEKHVRSGKRRKPHKQRQYYRCAETCTYQRLINDKNVPEEINLVGDGPDNYNFIAESEKNKHIKILKKINDCQNHQNIKPENLETIFPYAAKKNHRNESKILLRCKYNKNKISDKNFTPRNILTNKMLRIFNACCSMLSTTKRQADLKKSLKEERLLCPCYPKLSKRLKSALDTKLEKNVYKKIRSLSQITENAVGESLSLLPERKNRCNRHQELFKTRQKNKRVKFAPTHQVFTVTEFYNNFKGFANFDGQECLQKNRKSALNARKKGVPKKARKQVR